MEAQQEVAALSSPLTLPCGLVLPNRLAKAAMEEMLGTLGGGDPSEGHLKLYDEWSQGGWGMILTGNVQVSPTHLGSPSDVIVPFLGKPTFARSMKAFKAWAVKAHLQGGGGAPVIMQLCHTGRQSPRGSGRSIFTPSLAPSAIALNAGPGLVAKVVSRAMWGTPKEMDDKDLDDVVEGFVQGAWLARAAGFEGVQLHCSHGYLLAQFLSPNVNVRTDSYGGSPLARMTLLFRIIDAVRKEFPQSSGFCVGIKLNSSDYVEKDALDNVKWIAEKGGIDFIEISGGTYENAAMLGEDNDAKAARSPKAPAPSSRTVAREAFFISFASEARSLLSSLPSSSLPSPAPVIMVTGGFRTRSGMAQALTSSAADLVGIGRPACADPALPKTLLDPTVAGARAPKYLVQAGPLKYLPVAGLVLPGLSTIFHTMLLAQVAKGEKPDTGMTVLQGAWRVWIKGAMLRGWWWFTLAIAGLFALVQRLRV